MKRRDLNCDGKASVLYETKKYKHINVLLEEEGVQESVYRYCKEEHADD